MKATRASGSGGRARARSPRDLDTVQRHLIAIHKTTIHLIYLDIYKPLRHRPEASLEQI